MKIAVYGQKLCKKNIPYFNQFMGYASSHSIEIHIEKSFFHILSSFEEFKNLDFPVFSHYKELITQDFSLMFTFGGDGTILSAITLIRDSGIPIVGVNTGNLGFLATFNKEVFVKKIDQIFNKKLHIMPRSLLSLETSIMGHHNKFFNFALNEIVILRKEMVSMITIDAYIDNEFLTSYWADGLIISTPTGSTGYSLSCGGPIIGPENKNFVLTPISPHNLFSRPLIISDHQKVYLKIHSRVKSYSLSMDTRLTSLNQENELYIQKAPFYIYLLQEGKNTYYKTLREKLLWGIDQRN